MIKAKEAREIYNQELQLAEQFIKSNIEPKILSVAEKQYHCNFEVSDAFYQGVYFSDLKIGQFYRWSISKAIDVTKLVIKILEKNGYKITTKLKKRGNEYQLGCGYITISWEK